MHSLPSFLNKYFWGDNLDEINLQDHKKYIAKTILSIGDLKAVRWLHSNFDKNFLKSLLDSKQIDDKSRNFWKLYYS